MKIFRKALLEVFDEMEEELSKTGRSFAVHYAREAVRMMHIYVLFVLYLFIVKEI